MHIMGAYEENTTHQLRYGGSHVRFQRPLQEVLMMQLKDEWQSG